MARVVGQSIDVTQPTQAPVVMSHIWPLRHIVPPSPTQEALHVCVDG
jgi:hypothetical protein